MDVPIIFCSGREGGVGAGEEAGGDFWCDVDVEDVVEGEGGEDFVGVEGEGAGERGRWRGGGWILRGGEGRGGGRAL